MSSFLPPIGRSSHPYGQLPLPPGSALRFSADDLSADEQRLSNSNALMQNLETEMGRLLEWAGAGGGKAPARADEPGSAAQRREDLHAYLDARADVHQKRAKRRELTEPTGVRLPRQPFDVERHQFTLNLEASAEGLAECEECPPGTAGGNVGARSELECDE